MRCDDVHSALSRSRSFHSIRKELYKVGVPLPSDVSKKNGDFGKEVTTVIRVRSPAVVYRQLVTLELTHTVSRGNWQDVRRVTPRVCACARDGNAK